MINPRLQAGIVSDATVVGAYFTGLDLLPTTLAVRNIEEVLP
jgi:hypothetical protein